VATLIALAAISLFTMGGITGIVGVVSLAIRREERNLTLTREATDNITRAGRWLNGVHLRAPLRADTADLDTLLVPCRTAAEEPSLVLRSES
jgi:hypothetical protein